MELSDKQLDELVNAWFEAAERGVPYDCDVSTEEFFRYRITKVLEALEKMTTPTQLFDWINWQVPNPRDSTDIEGRSS